MSAVLTRVHEADGVIAVVRTQDVEPILDGTHARRVAGMTGSSDIRHAASIPLVLVEAYCNQNHVSFDEFMSEPKHIKAMCNDPVLRPYRIWEGRV